MNEREVYLVYNSDEVYLGTVEEFLVAESGISVNGLFSDMVSELAFGDYLPDFIIKQNFSIELRVPRGF